MITIFHDRLRTLFGNPRPPEHVWERQFDHFDDELRQLCKTPWTQIDISDLWFYYHDLAYVELQPEVFEYLFPVCLMAWHATLMNNVACSSGDAEFHFAVHHGRVLETMMTPDRREAVYEFFRDSFLLRLDQERGFAYQGSRTTAYGWMCRLNSLGIVMPRIDLLWNSWWALDTPGRAVAALEYCSGLIYPFGQNPLFPAWTPKEGGGDPPLLGHDSYIVYSGWMADNTSFLRDVLRYEFVREKLYRAVEVLATQPEYSRARQMTDDLERHANIVRARVEELPVLLSAMNEQACWSK